MNSQHLLKQNDLAVTPAREALLEILQLAKTPLDINQIIGQLEKKHLDVDRVTVFRTINTFVEKNIARQLEFGEGKARYELTSLPHHHHAICKQCGSVQDIEACEVEKLEKKVAKDLSFDIQSHRLEFFGLCMKCQK
jgi:Fur family ferric uptake transcriptional regulator